MDYQLHDSQINGFVFDKNTIIANFSKGFWKTDENGKQFEQMKNCKMAFEIDGNGRPVGDLISVRISKKGGLYKIISLKKFVDLLKKSPFDIDMEYDCNFANSKMWQTYSNQLRIRAEIFIEEIKKVEYLHE